jgi:hypothetical protein
VKKILDGSRAHDPPSCDTNGCIYQIDFLQKVVPVDNILVGEISPKPDKPSIADPSLANF